MSTQHRLIAESVANALFKAALPTSETNKSIATVTNKSAADIKALLKKIGIEATVSPYLCAGRLAFMIVSETTLGVYENEALHRIHGWRTCKGDLDQRTEVAMLMEMIDKSKLY